ncbi:EAL domain-containing protein [Sedimentitalea todarodis]|uniref:EAL domain-containing protein n=1 Tax=Sedimentitalea todarodis TaxID=1631240 RepID=A0ABU3VI14_9RHOB|nr:EAL domain-containing protein [Sedimentitalea todarodis]MDU9005816.1 EAL domain-containing protein [Sedimentitalea todarodis]
MSRRRKINADIPEGGHSPLDAVVTSRDKQTLDMVRQAVQSGQTMLAFQPVLQARPPQQVAFYEGLIRVLDQSGRVIPARTFMSAIESTELGREIDCLALETGLRTLAANPSIRLSLNMSVRSVGYKRWMRILDRHLKNDATVGERLVLEISEQSAMMMPDLTVDFMDGLQDRNIGFALDNFGSGALVLQYLNEFYFDAVKLNGAFMHRLQGNPDNQSIVRALIAVAKQFDMLIIAGSVERRADAELLVSAGVDCLQGHLFGAPTVRPPWIAQTGKRRGRG